MLGELSGAGGEALDDVVLEVAELVEIDLRLGEFDAPGLGVARLVSPRSAARKAAAYPPGPPPMTTT